MQLAFYLDQTRCTGCWTCIIACKDWNNIPAGRVSWRKVTTIQRGKYPEPFLAFLSTSCHHCADPACASACPHEAITKRAEDGIVVVDADACIGHDDCGACLEACPYHALHFGDGENPKVQKCDFCLERWSRGELPICVASCPMRALDAGPLDEIEERFGSIRQVEGFEYDETLRPSVVFKPKLRQTGHPTSEECRPETHEEIQR
ncbi:4Fe-4S dicluster domain-containing protein [bacterium]|nr:4Fe-4S dicluster domain-containing protein [bacterium]